jgi:hypothetical protein
VHYGGGMAVRRTVGELCFLSGCGGLDFGCRSQPELYQTPLEGQGSRIRGEANRGVHRRRALETPLYPRSGLQDCFHVHRENGRPYEASVLPTFSLAVSDQFLQQRLGLLQVFRIKPFSEPVVDGG